MRNLLSLFLLFSLNLFAAGTEIQLPPLTSPVMDEAGFLSGAEREELGRLIRGIYSQQGPQITVLTVNDLQGNEIEEFSIRVAEKWQLGTKEKDNGLLILVSKAERKMRIEVGQGIEGEVTDYDSNLYIRDVLTPAFRQGQFYEGLRTVITDIGGKFNVDPSTGSNAPLVRPASRQSPIPGSLIAAFPFLIGVLIIGQLFLRRRPFARGLFTGVGMAGVGTFMGLASLATIGFIFLVGLFIGIIGLHNLLFALASGSSHRGGGFGGFGGGGGGWGGGGGGFSGGGSSGNW